MSEKIGIVQWISGPVVEVAGVRNVGLYELVEIGEDRLMGEVIELEGEVATVQVYESTSGLRPGADAYSAGTPLYVELGPGLLGTIYDGTQRPLERIQEQMGYFIHRGAHPPALDRDKRWHFTPSLKRGEEVKGGDILGTVQETVLIEHRILVPPKVEGTLVDVVPEGDYAIDEVVATVRRMDSEQQLTLYHRWPIRQPRPYGMRLMPSVPLVTGQRVIDTLFPIAKGGKAAIPGGFGTGKTVTQHQLAKWANADIILFIGCGERGNEMTDVLMEFPKLIDPKSGRPLMERTVLIANTSNMPVAAREASIYTGITIAEYFRDMGYHVAVLADSTSRWAEALREISGRLEEMPAEEGFPAYLPSRLAEFYERAGRVLTLRGDEGSVSIVGAVSPPGGDFSEPVTQHTKRFIRCFWALDKDLASARHYPAINWTDSYSEYTTEVGDWWGENASPRWRDLRAQVIGLLHEDDRLQQIVKLVGPDTLPDQQRLILEVARLIKEAFLQQGALDEVDTYCSPAKQVKLLEVIFHFYERGQRLIALGCPVSRLRESAVVPTIIRLKSTVPNEEVARLDEMIKNIDAQMDALERDYRDHQT
jgi:V/A-type H+-transporting ATPase subunit A